MPVGNSDNGVGLWAGQVMFALDNTNQYIDWWHESLPGEKVVGSNKTFEHEGTLSSVIINPKITIGLTNYWNITLSQSLGNRYMNWSGDTTTIHHRDEGTQTNFINAIGGWMGDTRVTMRYLIFNDGAGNGKRFFVGTGLVIPSKSTLTFDPFFLNGEQKKEHRHFSLSEGVYKWVLETQIFKKRSSNPVFFGGTLTSEFPLNESKYGFKASQIHSVSLNALTKPIEKINASLGFRADLRYSTKAFWNEIESPNSEAIILTLGGGGLWSFSSGVLGLNIGKPFFLSGAFAGIESEGEQGQKVNTWSLSISFRKVFDFVIPWLDPLKNL